MDSNPPLGRILTFYSYKGGTGRSMALANVAWVLAASGRRVLVIDWDLEAPGLHRYFRPFLIDEELAASDGLIDLVDNYANQAIRPVEPATTPDPDWYLEYSDFTDYVVSVNFEHFPAGGKIDFLPAGRQNDRYALTVNSFNWQNFYDRLGGGGFFEAVKARARTKYDYVLIDSRTGVSDTAGICSVQMPDSLVVCFTYNNQSIKGAAAIAQSAVRMKKKLLEEKLASRRAATSGGASSKVEDTPVPYRVFPIPMRVDSGESDRLAVRQAFARVAFADLVAHISASELSEYWAGVEIPHKAFYSYEEVLAAFKDDAHDPKTVLSAFVRLTRYVTNRDVTDYRLPLVPQERQRLLDAFAETPLTAQSKRTVETRRETEEEVLARTAEVALAALADGERLIARRVFGRLVRLGRDEEGGGYFPIRTSIRDFSEAETTVIGKLADHGLLQVVSERGRTPSPMSQTVDGRSRPADQTVALADERLVKAWKLLLEWLDADREFLLWRQQLRTYLGDWERSQRDASALLGGQLLNEAEHWRLRRADEINAAEASYLAESRAAATAAAEARDAYKREYAETIRASLDQTQVVGDAGSWPVPAEQSSKVAARADSALRASSRLTIARVIGVAAAVLAIALAYQTWQRQRPDATLQPASATATDAMRQIAVAYTHREAGRIADAIAALSEGLRLAADDRVLTRKLYQDRAFCYKLGGDWDKSIADLTSALSIDEALGRTQRAPLLRDRGGAYFQTRDLELALVDYQALAALEPGSSTQVRDYLNTTLRSRGTSPTAVFLFTEVGPLDQNDPSVIPRAVQRMGRYADFLNLRFWWYRVPAAEMRYTHPDDATLASQASEALRSQGFAVGPPVLLNSLVPRSRRIEVWFPRTKSRS